VRDFELGQVDRVLLKSSACTAGGRRPAFGFPPCRLTSSEEDHGGLLENPARSIELSDAQLDGASGGLTNLAALQHELRQAMVQKIRV
jgi:hypothetical protein